MRLIFYKKQEHLKNMSFGQEQCNEQKLFFLCDLKKKI